MLFYFWSFGRRKAKVEILHPMQIFLFLSVPLNLVEKLNSLHTSLFLFLINLIQHPWSIISRWKPISKLTLYFPAYKEKEFSSFPIQFDFLLQMKVNTAEKSYFTLICMPRDFHLWYTNCLWRGCLQSLFSHTPPCSVLGCSVLIRVFRRASK